MKITRPLLVITVSLLAVALTFGLIGSSSRFGSADEIVVPGSSTTKSFLMDRNLVTVADFKLFVKATGYVTEAERYGTGGVFNPSLGAYVLVEGATFRNPFGPDGGEAKADHPVTQVSWNDAAAYAAWKGKRLPSKAEWEYAASDANRNGAMYSWGDALVQNGKHKANTWQGSFPFQNTLDDGYEFTSPVGAFGANELGLTDMGGNVWQWCSDEITPTGIEKIMDASVRKVLKGGSYLCDPLVCHGYAIGGESSSTPESSMAHIGFRCVRDIE